MTMKKPGVCVAFVTAGKTHLTTKMKEEKF